MIDFFIYLNIVLLSQKLFSQNPPQNFTNNPPEQPTPDENNFINFQNSFMGNAPLMDNFFKGGAQTSITNPVNYKISLCLN